MPMINDYREGEGASHALAASLAQELSVSTLEPLFQGDDWAILRTGQIIDARSMGDRPFRRMGRNVVTEPRSFATLVSRYATGATTIWADRDESSVIAIFNDHPRTQFAEDPDLAPNPVAEQEHAGHGDHSGVLQLALHDDYRSWVQHDGKLLPQRAFGEHIEDMSYTMVRPDAATMLEVATTLTMTSVVDASSKVRLENGDVEFRFVQESQMKAGRGAATVAIPSTFTFTTPIWEGTEAVEFEARLRVQAQQPEGVKMGYKLIRRSDIAREAFDNMIDDVQDEIPPFVQIFRGRAAR